MAELGKGVTAVVTSANFGANAELINALPDLKAICSWGVSAHARGVQVSNTPDVLTDCVADLAWGLLIAGARRMGQGERFVRAGQWGQVHGSIPLGQRVSGKKLGIVGLAASARPSPAAASASTCRCAITTAGSATTSTTLLRPR
ncbi:hypothetical protein WJ972_12040 [Achromobacter insuavis]